MATKLKIRDTDTRERSAKQTRAYVEEMSRTGQRPAKLESIDVTDLLRDGSRSRLKIAEDHADIVPAPQIPDFDLAPTRNRNAGWTAERQRRFIEHLALTGHVGEACGVVGVSSSSAYRLKHKSGAEAFSMHGTPRFASPPPPASRRSHSTAR